jgi:hypothetical protein
LVEDQDLLFGPQEVRSATLIEANLKNADSELVRVHAELAQKEQRRVMEIALNARVADADAVRDSSLKAVVEAQTESSNLKREKAGELPFHCFLIYLLGLFLLFSELFCFSFSSC